MTCRVHLPADHNHTVARYKRTLQEAFPCDASAAVPMHRASASISLASFAAIWLLLTTACLLLVWLQI